MRRKRTRFEARGQSLQCTSRIIAPDVEEREKGAAYPASGGEVRSTVPALPSYDIHANDRLRRDPGLYPETGERTKFPTTGHHIHPSASSHDGPQPSSDESPSMIELHVWNRAFGLPSLDPECLAAIAFLSAAIPQDLWVLVESNNVSISPNGALPALKDGSQYIGGFDSIVSYLSSRSSGRSDIDRNLSEIQKAQATAYRSFIRKTCLPITSLSLYVTSKNWVRITRPLYSTFLRFPLQYEIPHSHHARAIAATSHLSSLIRDIAAEDSNAISQPFSTAFAGLTASKTDEQKDAEKGEKITTRVKLRNFLADFLDPIREKLNREKYFFGGSSPTSVDCLLLGYMSLLVYPDLPSPWAKEIIHQEFADLVRYVDALKKALLGDGIDRKEPEEADRLTFSSWVANGAADIPRRMGWVDGIPLEEEDWQKQSSSFWVALQGIVGLVAAAGGIFAYKTLTSSEVEVEVQEKIGDAEVYTTARAEVGDASAAGTRSVNEFSERETAEPLPIFKVEDMLGLRL
ncbi:hypothetical protein H072_2183 [Dactylellina haptotyla CBS 200.50]|uniref:Mitochondrial outer membrane transport complex Sam37/metaxin N-terminal domain-containing protein n=1 Tax=Dactylellina haptotyla (strain CBS 200.50) TaxID=1284197 RepID=S8ALW4_DACHA|nr:hypothetical protein H072_2183 [Dactylellina haptotyla CBS 200.50]